MRDQQLLRPPPLDRESALFIDFDGTLVAIAPRPELVRVPADLPALLDRVAGERSGAVALVTGRRVADVGRLMHPWQGAIAGLHGAERRRSDGSEPPPEPADRGAVEALAHIRPRMRAFADRSPGTLLEDKGRTLALHYRGAPERAAEIRALADALLSEYGEHLRLIDGKMLVELQPRLDGKHRAIDAFMEEPPFRGRRPIFLGDDTTDEDGFAEVNRRNGVSIRVGAPDAPTAARHHLPSVEAVWAWLSAER